MYSSNPVYTPTPSYKHQFYPTAYSSYFDNYGGHFCYISDCNSGSSSSYYPSPATIVYPDMPPTCYPESRSEYSSSGIYAIPLPTGYSDYPAGCACVALENLSTQTSLPTRTTRTRLQLRQARQPRLAEQPRQALQPW